MSTTPTDDLLANSDRTVGVRVYRDRDVPKGLKRDALLFDQIGIHSLDRYVIAAGIHVPFHVADELVRLRDIGIVRDVPPRHFRAHQYLDAIAAETGEPIDVKVIPDERLNDEVSRHFLQEPGLTFAVLSRLHCINFRLDGINAFPILENRRQIGDVFQSGITPVLEVVLKSMPIPDDQTPWESIIEFRNDPEAMKRLRRLRVWTRKFAKATTATSLAEMKEEIEALLDEYEEHMKLHRMKVNKGATETLLTIGGKMAEDLVKLKFAELAKVPFILRERRINLLEAEQNAPNRELAFVSMARSRFSR